MSAPHRVLGGVLMGVAVATSLLAVTSPARAYRPFDGTDADVAEEGTFELEAAPIGYLHESDLRALVLPSVVLNQGLIYDTELVLQTNRVERLGRVDATRPRTEYLDTGVFLKHVWLEGTLQHDEGPSLATEAGALVPTGVDQHAVGAIVNTIVSVVTPSATFHFDVAPSLSVGHHFDLFVATIVEGPHAWAVRPVMEVYFEREVGLAAILSGLLGAIWRAREGLQLDVGARLAEMSGSPIYELRAGVTWAYQLWGDNEPEVEGPPAILRERRR